MAASARRLGEVWGGDRGTRIHVRFDGMDSMTIGADRRLPIASTDGLPVDTGLKLLLNRSMAFRTRHWHIELEDRGLGIAGLQNFMRAMTIRTDRGFLGSSSNCAAVNALLVGQVGLRAVSAGLHDKFLSMTGSTGGR